MWPFKKKKGWVPAPLSEEAFNYRVENVIRNTPTSHAKCEKCGKTDFKNNMVKHAEAKIETFCIYLFDSGNCSAYGQKCTNLKKEKLLNCKGMAKSSYIDTYYQHKSCRKPQRKKNEK